MKMDIRNFNVFKLLLILAAVVQLISSQNCPKMTLKNGRVRIRSRGRMAQFRCRRGFTRMGERFAVCLKSGIWSQKPPLCVGRGCPSISKIPNLTVEKQSKGGVLKFKCDKGRRVGPESVYCDGTQWSSEPPTCLEGMSLGCDFETKDLCGWNQDDKDDFDWTWHKGDTPTQDTGPSVDHTTNSSKGHYIFMESSSPKKMGHKARLISPPYQPDGIAGVCLEFFYHMWGPSDPGFVGDLSVYAVPSTALLPLLDRNAFNPRMALFHVEGNQGNMWHKADLDIRPQSEPFVFVFQGTRQRGWNGDLALDDILLYNCSDRSTTISTTSTPVMMTSTAEFTSQETSSNSVPVSSQVFTSASTTISPTSETTAADETSVSSSGSVPPSSQKSSGMETSSSWSTETVGVSSQRPSSPDDTDEADEHVSGEAVSNDTSTANSFSPTDSNVDNDNDDSNEKDEDSSVDTSKDADVGRVKGDDGNSSFTELLPLIIGVIVAVLVGAIVIGLLAWMWAKKQRQKEEKDMEDQMNIIAEYVETNMMS